MDEDKVENKLSVLNDKERVGNGIEFAFFQAAPSEGKLKSNLHRRVVFSRNRNARGQENWSQDLWNSRRREGMIQNCENHITNSIHI